VSQNAGASPAGAEANRQAVVFPGPVVVVVVAGTVVVVVGATVVVACGTVVVVAGTVVVVVVVTFGSHVNIIPVGPFAAVWSCGPAQVTPPVEPAAMSKFPATWPAREV
jgi:hypothetical protein